VDQGNESLFLESLFHYYIWWFQITFSFNMCFET